jgi:hypothetical protein
MMKTDRLQIFSWLVLLFVLGLAVNAVRTQRREIKELRQRMEAVHAKVQACTAKSTPARVRRQETTLRSLSNEQPACVTRMLRLFSTLALWRQSATKWPQTPLPLRWLALILFDFVGRLARCAHSSEWPMSKART